MEDKSFRKGLKGKSSIFHTALNWSIYFFLHILGIYPAKIPLVSPAACPPDSPHTSTQPAPHHRSPVPLPSELPRGSSPTAPSQNFSARGGISLKQMLAALPLLPAWTRAERQGARARQRVGIPGKHSVTLMMSK